MKPTSEGPIARAAVDIDVPRSRVWDALVDPRAIKQYMFGTNVASDWKPGSPITWKGEWQGKAYEDKGTILEMVPGAKLSYSHFSPLAGLPDRPENYHHVSIALTGDERRTHVALEQDNNADEKAREHSEQNWTSMLAALKKYLEG
jgi:uncharacterized protein YndB with AHSA1/START domain